MKTLYLECSMGAAGDMLMAALLELYDEPQAFIDRMNGLGLPGVKLERTRTEQGGIQGSRITVTVNGEEEHSVDVSAEETNGAPAHAHHGHPHAGHGHIKTLIASLPLSEAVKADAQAVYDLIAQAEATVHNRPVGDVHFHEVGSLDAVADVVGCCLLMELLAPEKIMASPVRVGSGHVRCAHGLLPVPAPATAILLQGIPIYGGDIPGELCTPTGAALLKHFVSEFAPMPVLRVGGIGYGMGHKVFPAVNCLRAYLGDGEEPGEEIAEISCNLDDMTGEAIAYAAELLMNAGALDVFTTPITMKKGRPAVMLTCLCRLPQEQAFAKLLLENTTTLGVRMSVCRRNTLSSVVRTVETPYGAIRYKTSSGYGIEKSKPEYADVQAAAREHGVPFQTVWDAVEDAAHSREQ